MNSPAPLWLVLVFQIAGLAITLLGIAVTAIMAVNSIQRAAEEERLSVVHTEMRGCLTETLRVLGRALDLLDDVANRVTYATFDELKPIETAHERYWKEIASLSNAYRVLGAKQQLLLPKALWDRLKHLTGAINAARHLATNAKPETDTTQLKTAVSAAGKAYRRFINDCRAYIKSDNLAPLDTWQFTELHANESTGGETVSAEMPEAQQVGGEPYPFLLGWFRKITSPMFWTSLKHLVQKVLRIGRRILRMPRKIVEGLVAAIFVVWLLTHIFPQYEIHIPASIRKGLSELAVITTSPNLHLFSQYPNNYKLTSQKGRINDKQVLTIESEQLPLWLGVWNNEPLAVRGVRFILIPPDTTEAVGGSWTYAWLRSQFLDDKTPRYEFRHAADIYSDTGWVIPEPIVFKFPAIGDYIFQYEILSDDWKPIAGRTFTVKRVK